MLAQSSQDFSKCTANICLRTQVLQYQFFATVIQFLGIYFKDIINQSSRGEAVTWRVSTVHQCPLVLASIVASNPAEVFPSCQSFSSYCLVQEIQHTFPEDKTFVYLIFFFFIFLNFCIRFSCFILNI